MRVLALVLCLAVCGDIYSQNEQDLKKTLERFNQAFATGDIASLNHMITEDYVHTNGSSESISGSEWIKYLKTRNLQIEEGDLVVNSYSMDQIKIHFISKSIAIVTGRITTSFTQKGTRHNRQYRVTHVWRSENDQWRRAVFHDTPIDSK